MFLLGAIQLDHRVEERRGGCGRRGRSRREERREEEEQQKAGETRREGGVLRHGGDLSSNCQDGPLGCSCRRRDDNFSTSGELFLFFRHRLLLVWFFFFFNYFYYFHPDCEIGSFRIGFFSFRLSIPAGLFKWWKSNRRRIGRAGSCVSLEASNYGIEAKG